MDKKWKRALRDYWVIALMVVFVYAAAPAMVHQAREALRQDDTAAGVAWLAASLATLLILTTGIVVRNILPLVRHPKTPTTTADIPRRRTPVARALAGFLRHNWAILLLMAYVILAAPMIGDMARESMLQDDTLTAMAWTAANLITLMSLIALAVLTTVPPLIQRLRGGQEKGAHARGTDPGDRA